MQKILYVDDDETSRLSLARLLEQDGFQVETAINGIDGRKVLEAREFDCLISDLNMEGNVNMEFIRAVSGVRPGLPIIILTGYPSADTAGTSDQIGVSAYLLKPVDYEELRSVLQKTL